MESTSAKIESPRRRSVLIGLLLFTLAVRVAVLFLMPGALADDPDDYRRLAENLVEHATFGNGAQPTAYRPVLYPLMLAPCVALGGASTVAIGVLHVLLGLGTVWLVWRLAWHCGLGRWAVLAGLLVACDPILLGQSTLIMTETAATFWVTLALYCLVGLVEKPSIAQATSTGVALALCGLCRPELLLWAALCMPVLWILIRRNHHEPSLEINQKNTTEDTEEHGGANVNKLETRDEKSNAKRNIQNIFPSNPLRALRVLRGEKTVLIWLSLGLLLTLSPWIIRNQIQFGRPIATTTHGGYTLLLANNPSFYEYLQKGDWGTVWDARQLGPGWAGDAHHAGPANELAADRRAYREARSHIQNSPGEFAYACLIRVGRFWALAPHQGSLPLRLMIGAWYLAEFLLAAVGLWIVSTGRLRSANAPAATTSGATTPGATGVSPVRHWQNASGTLRGQNASGTRATRFWCFGLLLTATLTGVHAVFWSNMRMRAPLAAVVALAATVAVAWWTDYRGKS